MHGNHLRCATAAQCGRRCGDRRQLFVAISFLFLLRGTGSPQVVDSHKNFKPDAAGYVGSEACAKCHQDIYRSYMQTAMARASGPAAENLIPGRFNHDPSGVQYEVYASGGKAWLSFNRPNDPMVRGKRELLFYIGQGRRGRTYLFSVDGFVFEAPVNWYAGRHMWDMPPAYSDTREIPMNLPAVMSCLACHGSGTEPPLEGTENRYKPPIFSHSGVTCERCHGPGEAHVRGGSIVNPAKLSARLRDQECMQCHLEGKVAIERSGQHLYEYRPGDDLFRYVRYFVLSGAEPANLRAASQFEALSESVCKKKSGDAMSCISCHDPHQTPRAEERVGFYRAKCVACHGPAFAAKHHPDHLDCTACHLPASLSSDVAHTEVTDHRIWRRSVPPLELPAPANAFPELVPFPDSERKQEDIRDLALAWQALVNSGLSAGQHHAERLLRQALERSPDDPAFLSSLAYVEQKRGADKEARRLYIEALKRDPDSIDAATNLAVLDAKEGHMSAALQLWQSAFARAPGRSAIGMNLARSLCEAGRYDQAQQDVMRVLQFNPDLGAAKQLLLELNKTPPECGS